jgi:hypothetical protein
VRDDVQVTHYEYQAERAVAGTPDDTMTLGLPFWTSMIWNKGEGLEHQWGQICLCSAHPDFVSMFSFRFHVSPLTVLKTLRIVLVMHAGRMTPMFPSLGQER